jgi:UDP:flavonoid glycosyltransferase YjiC (YdhE family)
VRVTIIAIGSRGDVQPFVALGTGLADAGHEVRLATHRRYESLVRERPLEFAPVAEGSVSRGPETDVGRRWAEKGTGKLPAWVGFLQDAKSVAHRRLADCRDACAGTEAIVVSGFATLIGYQLADVLGVPLVRAYTAPASTGFVPTSQASRGPRWVTEYGRKARERAARQAIWLCARPWVNSARRDVLGHPPLPVRELYGSLDRRRVPLLYGFSPAVFTLPEQKEWVHVTGYWFLDQIADWKPPRALTDFLAAGPPPVFVGWGSIAERTHDSTTPVVVEALARAGARGIVQLPGSADDADLPPEVFALDTVPHDWLFPRVAAAVHSAGPGTTAATLRAGVPSVPVPTFADQPFWAQRVYELGVAPRPIPRKRLSAERLASAIRIATTDRDLRQRAATLGERIRAEDGVARAVEAFEHHVIGSRVAR